MAAGLADPASLPGRLWVLLAEWDRVTPAVIPRLLAHVPAVARAEFATACRAAASPDFRLPPWLRDGQPMTWAELEADAERRSDRVRAWAAELLRELAAAGEAGGTGPGGTWRTDDS